MIEKLWFLMPEMIVFGAACIVSVMGLARTRAVRDLTPLVAGLGLLAALIVTPFLYNDAQRVAEAGFLLPYIGQYVKMAACGVGILLVLVNTGFIDRGLEAAVAAGRAKFDPIRVTRGEFFAFFLFSITGLMLVCNASDLIWLFLALELTSLPTYVMVAMSRGDRRAQEAAVKYFFLGALAAAIFLYGFALLYGATGTIVLTEMREVFAQQVQNGGITPLGIVGMILSVLGVGFKLAAAPLHFYAADVYEGAASAVTAFLAFVPKFAGTIAIVLLLATVGWSGHYGFGPEGDDIAGLPQHILTTLWMVAVLTMTLGNVAALLQKSVKRMLAYSSIAHSGYILIGIIAGPGIGIRAVLFYILAYGIMNTAAFAVLAGLERRGQEVDSLADLSGLREKQPMMAGVLAIAAGSLIGLPPLLGFWAKLYLFIAGIEAGHIVLVIIAAINSAISAWYYLALVKQPLIDKQTPQAEAVTATPYPWPRLAGVIGAAAIVILPIFTAQFIKASDVATRGYDRVAGTSHDGDAQNRDQQQQALSRAEPEVDR